MIKQQQEQEVSIGDTVRLNSGSPDLEVVACNDDLLTVQLRPAAITLPRACVYRVVSDKVVPEK